MAASDFNLLEWYAAHRGEVAVLRDPAALFALGLLDHVGETPRGELQQDLGVDAAQLDRTIEQLYAAGFVTTRGTTLAVTPSGKQFLTEIGLRGPLPPPTASENPPQTPKPPTPLTEPPPAKPLPPAPRMSFWLWAVIAILVIGIVVVAGVLLRDRGAPPPTGQSPTRGRPTGVVPSPTPFIEPGTEIVFQAEPAHVALGDCAILAWQVSNAHEVYLNNQPVNLRDRDRVCPKETTTYTLTVISPSGEKQTETIDVIVTQPQTNYVWAIVSQDPPFDDPRIRNAMAHAIDEPAIAGAVLQGNGTLRSTDPKLNELENDLGRAQQLSKEAGYEGQPVFIVPNQDRTSVEIANQIAKYLAGAGFDARLVTVESRATILVGPEP